MTTDVASAGRVLIVDDERLNVDVLSRVLRRDGYEVTSAPNGALAGRTAAAIRMACAVTKFRWWRRSSASSTRMTR